MTQKGYRDRDIIFRCSFIGYWFSGVSFCDNWGKVFLFLPMIQKRSITIWFILGGYAPSYFNQICSFYYITNRFVNNSKSIIFWKLLLPEAKAEGNNWSIFTRDDNYFCWYSQTYSMSYLFIYREKIIHWDPLCFCGFLFFRFLLWKRTVTLQYKMLSHMVHLSNSHWPMVN
jgi:hypothetical protein